jgi:ribosomal protein L19
MTIIQVKIKNVYGVERIYPVNDTAILLIKLLKKKTIDRDEIEVIKKLGYQIEVITESL